MTERLDLAIAALAAAPLDRDLGGLEAAVGRGLEEQREILRTTRALAPIQAGAVALALAIGVTAGGMAAATELTQPRQLSPFSTTAHLAPSNLLEGAR